MTDTRHENRENAFTLLFAKDFDREASPEEFYNAYLENNGIRYPAKVKDMFTGTCMAMEDIDREIEETSVKWKVSRMTTVTRTALRLAVYEMNAAETPVKVVINEAIELVKKYDEENAPSFVNGILNKIARNRELISAENPQ